MLPPSQVDNDEHMHEADGGQYVTPPPHIKRLADKFARLIGSVRPRFEKSMVADNAGTPEYSFLNVTDPYHAYFQHRLSEFRAQKGFADAADHYLWLKEARKSMTGNKKKLTTSEWRTELQMRRERLLQRLGAAITVASPITGELIPAPLMIQHIRDPKHKELTESLFAKIRVTTPTAEDDKISTSVAWLAETRPDVFGTTDEEGFFNAVKAQIQSTTLDAVAAIVSPITRELIPVRQMSQHMQDPKHIAQKDKLFAKIREATLAKDDRISTTIAWLARTRPDVFVTTDEEEFTNVVKTEIESAELDLDRLAQDFSIEPNMMDDQSPGSHQQTPLPKPPLPEEEPEPKRQRHDDHPVGTGVPLRV